MVHVPQGNHALLFGGLRNPGYLIGILTVWSSLLVEEAPRKKLNFGVSVLAGLYKLGHSLLAISFFHIVTNHALSFVLILLFSNRISSL